LELFFVFGEIESGKSKNLEDYLFVHYEWNILENKISEIVVIRMLSPTKFHIDFHTFDHVDTFQSYLSDFNHDKSQFVYCGQNGTEEQFRKECDIPERYYIYYRFIHKRNLVSHGRRSS
jgi:hypothetical protein